MGSVKFKISYLPTTYKAMIYNNYNNTYLLDKNNKMNLPTLLS